MHDQAAQNAELRQTVERLTRKVEFLYRELRVSYPDDNVPLHVLEAQELVRQGRDGEAIKVIREHRAIGIVEAREEVEGIRRSLEANAQASGSAGPASQSFAEFETTNNVYSTRHAVQR